MRIHFHSYEYSTQEETSLEFIERFILSQRSLLASFLSCFSIYMSKFPRSWLASHTVPFVNELSSWIV